MTSLDWVVLIAWLCLLVGYGMYRGRGSRSVDQYLLAGKSMPWYAMGLSILATQASAVTFISTTGQGYVDGLRFAEFYFGLPLAMIVICAVAVPLFHRANVFTAYEYLEARFDAKTRSLVSCLFLIQRGLAAGIGLYAPAVALSVVFGWDDRWTTILIGALVVLYTTTGGIKALTWADVQQMFMIFIALLISLFVAFHRLPQGIGASDAVRLAGVLGRMRIVDTHLNWSDRYNLWSGLIGGGFLALAYFGCDQSQVQRYLTGRSIAQSRLSLLFNAIVKIPMQLLILFIGAMVLVLSLFTPFPAIFQPQEAALAMHSPAWAPTQQQYNRAFSDRRDAAYALAEAFHHGDPKPPIAALRARQADFTAARQNAVHIVERIHHAKFDDTNYIFLNFVTHYLPAGLVGLVIGVIFSASMGSTSGEINSLATVSMVDVYQRFLRKGKSDRHYLIASRVFNVFWGAFAVGFAAWGARGFGALIERVNIVGSLFYGSLLGVFVLAFGVKRVNGTAAFIGVVTGQIATLAIAAFTGLSFLWYNVAGCLIVIATALSATALLPANKKPADLVTGGPVK